jgi:hypothetical protein
LCGPHVAARGRTSGADPSVGRLAFVDYLVSHNGRSFKASFDPEAQVAVLTRFAHRDPRVPAGRPRGYADEHQDFSDESLFL